MLLCLFVCLFVDKSVCLSVSLFVYLFICLSVGGVCLLGCLLVCLMGMFVFCVFVCKTNQQILSKASNNKKEVIGMQSEIFQNMNRNFVIQCFNSPCIIQVSCCLTPVRVSCCLTPVRVSWLWGLLYRATVSSFVRLRVRIPDLALVCLIKLLHYYSHSVLRLGCKAA